MTETVWFYLVFVFGEIASFCIWRNREKGKSVQDPFKHLKFSCQFFLYFKSHMDLINSLVVVDNDSK